MKSRGPLILLSGPPAAGKSTVAGALAAGFPRGLHLPVDDLRGWATLGSAAATTRHHDLEFRLARTAAAQVANLYAKAGYAVVIDDPVFPVAVATDYAPLLRGPGFHRVALLPPVEIARQRNRERHTKAFDPAPLEAPLPAIHAAFTAQLAVAPEWVVVDNGPLDVPATVAAVLRACGLAA